MATLREMIAEMVDVQRAMGRTGLAAHQEPALKGELLTQRRRFVDLVTAVNRAIDTDPQLCRDPALASDFRQRFSQMRSAVAIHQAKWPVVMMDSQDPEYLQSAKQVIANNRAFADWALTVLK